jgi:protein TonB
VESNPQGYFEQSALEAIRHWRFKPGIYRGKAVATWVTLPIQFRLTE